MARTCLEANKHCLFVWLLLLLQLETVHGFAPFFISDRSARQFSLRMSLRDKVEHQQHPDEPRDNDTTPPSSSSVSFSAGLSRRRALQTAALLSSNAFLFPSRSNADNSILTTTGIDCLKDLPPFDPSTTVRLFLARHGETENNRLNKLQGSRIDAPINNTGERQAALLGQALRAAPNPPELVLHSPLIRARQTAQIASQQFDSNSSRTVGNSIAISTQPLDVLAELDFGAAAEGEPVEARRAQRLQTYASWASGNLDVRMNTGGESGREMLLRIERALQTLVSTASQTETGCIAAVAHSAYLRMLLATVSDISLLSAYRLKQANCCVNVLDLERVGGSVADASGNRPTKPSSPSLISGLNLGKPVSSLPLELRIPTGRVERVNETRHLQTAVAAAA